MASLHAQHKEKIAEALAEAKRESDARHEQQLAEAMRESETWHQQQLAETKREMAEAKRKMDEIISFLQKSVPTSLSLSNLLGNTNFAFNLMKLACLLQCIVMCYVLIQCI